LIIVQRLLRENFMKKLMLKLEAPTAAIELLAMSLEPSTRSVAVPSEI